MKHMVWLSQEAPLTLKAVHNNIVPIRIIMFLYIIYSASNATCMFV